MATLAIYDIGNQKVNDIELDEKIFGVKINRSLFYDVVRMHSLLKGRVRLNEE